MSFHNLKIALIADELTHACLKPECKLWQITPLNYKLVLKFWHPDLLFVESAWEGRRNAWKFRIASYPDYSQRSNAALSQVVVYARELGIPCVFWSKEDEKHFKDYCYVVDSREEALEVLSRLKYGYSPQDVERMRAGADFVLNNHTYTHRLQTILDTISGSVEK